VRGVGWLLVKDFCFRLFLVLKGQSDHNHNGCNLVSKSGRVFHFLHGWDVDVLFELCIHIHPSPLPLQYVAGGVRFCGGEKATGGS
jgi:hypothetical protein